MKTLAVIVFLGFPLVAFALPTHYPVPGGLAVVPLNISSNKPKPTVYSNKVSRLVTADNQEWYALIPLGLSQQPGTYKIKVSEGNTTKEIGFVVKSKKYREQRLTITNKRKVNPYAKDMDRIVAERKLIKAAKRHWQETTPDTDFLLPTEGRYSSEFGLKRFFNDQPRNPHRGLDVAAAEGTAIHAAADGVVTEAHDFFFSGNVVFIDHGYGLTTMYAHMSRIDVKPGQTVKKGEVIGAVGETGRVTGPHLHWSVYLNSVAIDPNLFLPEEKRHPNMRGLGKSQ